MKTIQKLRMLHPQQLPNILMFLEISSENSVLEVPLSINLFQSKNNVIHDPDGEADERKTEVQTRPEAALFKPDNALLTTFLSRNVRYAGKSENLRISPGEKIATKLINPPRTGLCGRLQMIFISYRKQSGNPLRTLAHPRKRQS